MAPPKVQGLETKAITFVYAGGEWVAIKPESFKEESEGYFFEDTGGAKYWVSQYGVVVSNHPQE